MSLQVWGNDGIFATSGIQTLRATGRGRKAACVGIKKRTTSGVDSLLHDLQTDNN